MSINIEIGANSTNVTTAITTANTADNNALIAKNRANDAYDLAGTAKSKAEDALNNTSALSGDITAMQATVDNLEEEVDGLDIAAIQRRIEAAERIAGEAATAAEAADSKAAAAEAAAQSADGKAQEAINAVDEIDPDAIAAQASNTAVTTLETNYGLTQIKETVNELGTTYVAINDVGTGKRFDFATPTQLDEVHDTLDERINQIEEQGVSDEQIQNAIENWEDPPIAMKAEVRDDIRIGVTDAKNSIMQEVGDMVDGVRSEAADEIDANQIAIPTVEEENSSNESFNELMSKLQEKPMRRADVLKKVIDENAFYWYVMPVIDQRIYRDTVVNGVIVEAGWQKAVKERFWYHKQDRDIRDNYIYLFRSDINQMIAKATEENTASNDKPQLMPMSGNPRHLRKKDELPSGLPILGIGKKTMSSGRKINQTIKISTPVKTISGLTSIPISGKLQPSEIKPSPILPDWAGQGKISNISDPANVIINSSISPLPSGHRPIMPYISPAEWAKKQQSEQDKRDLANGNYPSDFYYIACYAECDDSSMYEKGWFKLTNDGAADTEIGELRKRDNGTYYYLIWIDDSGSGSGEEGYYQEVTVTLDERAEFYVQRNEELEVTNVYWRIDDTGEHQWSVLQRRSFSDVSRDIKVHMLPIYLLGSTIIAIDSDDVDNDGKFNYVTIDSMISPALPSSWQDQTAKKASIVNCDSTTNEISLGESTHKSDGVHTDGRYNYICRDNIRMGESGLPCVYGQGYTWLPIDAKGDADDKGGLGIHCDYFQQQMWVADGIYSYYNGLIPSGYTKETLKNLTTMYKYKIVEKFIVGQWEKNADDTINTRWINNSYATQDDGRIDQAEDPITETYPNMVNIFVEDYSEDNIADLNEEIFDINIDDEYISYTIKDGMIVQDGADGGATVSNFIYDTLSYLTEKGKVNTNNIFLICVEDDGDEYIFDEYIWEKGQVLKLNEQKRIKYSEDLRKVEYVQATSVKPIGHDGTFVIDGQQFTVNAYKGEIVEGNTKDEQADKIIKYLSVLTQKDTGATIKNPSYVPAIPGNHVLGYRRIEEEMYATEQMYDFEYFTQYLQEITSCGIITFIASSIKQALLSCYANQKDTDEIVRAFNKLFISDTSYSIGEIGKISSEKWYEILGAITDPSHTDEKYSGLFKSQIEELYSKYSGIELTEALEIMFNDIFGPIIKPEEHPDDYDNVTNTYSDLINNYLKIVSYIKGEDGKKDTEEPVEPVEPEGGIPVSAPEENVKEGETEEETLRWIANHYRSKFMYLIEFAILNKIVDIEYPEGDIDKALPKEEFVESINKLFMDIHETMKSCNLESYIKESYQPLKEYIEIFSETFKTSEFYEDFRESFSDSLEGIFTGSEIGTMFLIDAEYNEYLPARGGTEYIPVKTDVWIPITTEGGDYLQKYNKILAFLIDKEPVGTSNGFEWIYSLWRYMPSSKQYATIGTVSTISVNEPDLNDKDIENEVGAANNTDVHSEISNAIRVAREDIIQRYDKLLTEEGILSKLPKINKILEQNFVSNTVGGETVYSLKNAITRSDLQLAVDRQNNIETNMSTLVNALNTGKRASYSNGVMIKLDENIFEQQTAAPNPPSPTAPQTLVIPETTGDAVVNNTVSTNTGKYFVDTTMGSTPIARRRIII